MVATTPFPSVADGCAHEIANGPDEDELQYHCRMMSTLAGRTVPEKQVSDGRSRSTAVATVKFSRHRRSPGPMQEVKVRGEIVHSATCTPPPRTGRTARLHHPPPRRIRRSCHAHAVLPHGASPRLAA